MDAPENMQSAKPATWPVVIHATHAIIRFPNGVQSGNWLSAPRDDRTIAYVPKTALDAATARAEAAEAKLAMALAAVDEIAAVVGCLEGKDSLDRELIRNIKASLALIKEPT